MPSDRHRRSSDRRDDRHRSSRSDDRGYTHATSGRSGGSGTRHAYTTDDTTSSRTLSRSEELGSRDTASRTATAADEGRSHRHRHSQRHRSGGSESRDSGRKSRRAAGASGSGHHRSSRRREQSRTDDDQSTTLTRSYTRTRRGGATSLNAPGKLRVHLLQRDGEPRTVQVAFYDMQKVSSGSWFKFAPNRMGTLVSATNQEPFPAPIGRQATDKYPGFMYPGDTYSFDIQTRIQNRVVRANTVVVMIDETAPNVQNPLKCISPRILIGDVSSDLANKVLIIDVRNNHVYEKTLSAGGSGSGSGSGSGAGYGSSSSWGYGHGSQAGGGNGGYYSNGGTRYGSPGYGYGSGYGNGYGGYGYGTGGYGYGGGATSTAAAANPVAAYQNNGQSYASYGWNS